MDLRTQLEQLHYPTMYYGHQEGVYELPAAWVEAYQALLADPAPRAATAHLRVLSDLSAWGGASELIKAVLQPALARHLATFAADVTLIGPYSELPELTPAQVVELIAGGQVVADAYQRYLQTHRWYQQIRTVWLVLRQRAAVPTVDPRGTESLLAEVANAPELLPDTWRNLDTMTGRGYVSAPWAGTAAHLRLAWIVRAGGKVWAPTAAQQDQAWRAYIPASAPTRPASHHVERAAV